MSNCYFTNLPEEPTFFIDNTSIKCMYEHLIQTTVFPPNFIVNKYLVEMFGLKVHNSH